MAATQETKEQFLELRANGESFAAIANKLGVSKSTVIKWSKELSAELANMKAIAHDDLLKRYKIGKEHNLRLWREVLDMLEAEIKARGFGDIKTTELIALMEKLSEKLAESDQGISLKDNPHQVSNPYGSIIGGDTITEYDHWQV